MLNLTLLNRLLPVAVALFIAAPAARSSSPEAGRATKPVRIYSTRDGNTTRFWVDNQEHCEVTVTFEVKTENLKSSVPLPHTAVFPAHSTTEAFILEPAQTGEKWAFSYTNHYKLGSYLAQHDDHYIYQLPYAPGRRYVVTQAYNGTYSHKGSNKYAIDWKMPEGTVIYAVRGGVVVKLRQDSNLGGPSMDFDKHNNYVLIRHDDGTLAHYCHLRHNGVLVNLGQRVAAGQPIARSGNTGFSSGPHLHLCIFRTVDGRERESIPVRFYTAEYGVATLLEDERYRAVEVGGSMLEARNSANPAGTEARGGGRGTAN